MTERGFFSRITEPITERVREGVDNVEEKVKGAITSMTDKAKEAVQSKVQDYQRSVVSFGVAGVLGWLGILSLVAAAILGVSVWLHPALAALVVALALFLIAGVLGAYGKSRLPQAPDPEPKRVAPALREQDEGVDHFWTD